MQSLLRVSQPLVLAAFLAACGSSPSPSGNENTPPVTSASGSSSSGSSGGSSSSGSSGSSEPPADAASSDDGSSSGTTTPDATASDDGPAPAEDGGGAPDSGTTGDDSGGSTFTLGSGNPNSMGLDRHDALYCGEWQKTNPVGDTIYVIKGGKVVWTHSLPTAGQDEFGDCWMASNGHVFFNRKMYGAQEIAPDMTTGKEGPIVWEYKEDPGTEVHSVQPIGLDKVLVMQNGLPMAKLMLIDKTKAMSCTSGMPCVLQTWQFQGTGAVHGMFRHVRMLANGNLLVPYTSGGKVVEYTQQMQNVWEWDCGPSPWSAVRLKNGDTLVGGNQGHWVQEVTPSKQVVWNLNPMSFTAFPLYTMQNTFRLTNGNTLINNWCPGGITNVAQWPTCTQVAEVTPTFQVVWAVKSWTNPNLGPGSSTQLLDQPGIPETPGDIPY